MADTVPSTARWLGAADPRVDNLTTLADGTRIGRYEIVGVLGAGAFGMTYRGRDLQLDRDVAIKEYLPSGFAARQPDLMVLPRSTQVADSFRWGRERFLDEARTLARLTDAPGVVDVFDFLEANGTAYMVMALVQGETLEARLKREGRLSQETVDRLLYPLLDGLAKVHAASFLHRDIKPANILINEDGQPTLIDFGAARVALQGRTQAMTAIYTPGYAAFEQFTSAQQGPWTDIYALGATLYHCISGGPPPAATDRMIGDTLAPATQIGAGRYAPELLIAIDAALRLKSAERPQTIAEWRHLLSGAPATATAGPTPSATRRIDRSAAPKVATPTKVRTARWIGVAAALAVLALTGAAAYMWPRLEKMAGPPAVSQGAQGDEAVWAAARSAGSAVALRAYIQEYPGGRYAAQARSLIEDVERRDREAASARQAAGELARVEEAAWTSARSAGTSAALRDFIARYPAGRHTVEARAALLDVERKEREDHSARQAAEDRTRADESAWANARSAWTIAALQSYIDRQPTGRYVTEARAAIRDIERREREASTAAPIPRSLLQIIARGRWAIGSEADCSRGVEATYRAEVAGNQIVWLQGNTRRFVEQIEEDAAQFARTLSVYSTLPGASNENVGTRWRYVLATDATIRVERASRPSFFIVRCPGT